MIPNLTVSSKTDAPAYEKIAYIMQMLGELRGVASQEGADMLCYLIEMAFVEAGDILSGRRHLSFADTERNKTASMPVKSAGKIQF